MAQIQDGPARSPEASPIENENFEMKNESLYLETHLEEE